MRKRLLFAGLCISVLMLATALPGRVALAQEPTPGAARNVTDDFEGAFTNDSYCASETCLKPEGWGVWFIPRKDNDPPGINVEPKFQAVKDRANRVKNGATALRQYTENATHTGGIYRILTDVKPGSRVKFTIGGLVWSTNDNSPLSTRPSSDIKLRIGIDPLGGNNGKASPLNGQVVWSSEQDAKDKFATFAVEAEAKAATVIVYTYATMKDPVRHNEVYWDDARIEVMAPVVAAASGPADQVPPSEKPAAPVPTATAAPAAKVASAPAQSQPAAASNASGVRHKVKSGDTLSGIALQYSTTVDQIRRLNGLQSDLLSIDQELIVQAPAAPPTPTLAPTAVAVAAAAAAAADAPEERGPGKLCVRAYFDMNGNGARDDGEDSVPNVAFSLSSNSAVIASYTSDGVNEPHCFESLVFGNYVASAIAPPNYNPTSPLNDSIAVPAGGQSKFDLGLRRVSDGSQIVQPTAPKAAPAMSAAPPNVAGMLAVVAGVMLVAGASGVAVTLLLRRRRL